MVVLQLTIHYYIIYRTLHYAILAHCLFSQLVYQPPLAILRKWSQGTNDASLCYPKEPPGKRKQTV